MQRPPETDLLTAVPPLSTGPSAGSGSPILHPKIRKDIAVLALFTGIYCRAKHADRARGRAKAAAALAPYISPLEADLCSECARTLLHGAAKRLFCPYDPKPRCKHCPAVCYAPGHRERVRAIMRFSGLRLIVRGRMDLLFKYWF